MQSDNPQISPLLRWVTAFEVSVLVVSGGGLFFLPTILGQWWPWPLTPFNTRLLGAIYVASLISALLLVLYNRWTPARIVTPMILIFTIIVLIVSLTNVSYFTVPWSMILWFALYIIIPLNAAYHLWLYRKLSPAQPVAIPATLRWWLRIQALVLGLYGLGLLIAPATFSAFWPWRIDDFHGRMYSVAFITPAVGAWLVSQSTSRVDLQTLGLTQIAGGLLPIIGMLIVSPTVPLERQINWSLGGTWLWTAIFAVLFLSGVVMVWQARET
jgi:hypothetical protein